MEYHKKYKHFNKKVIKAVRRTIKNGLFKANKPIRTLLLNDLNNNLCNIYGIEESKKPKIEISNYSRSYFNIRSRNDGYYNPILNIICLNDKLSLITYLHEFKHFLQHYKKKRNNENIARGYSLSLFYKATPKLFENALKKGLIIHQK